MLAAFPLFARVEVALGTGFSFSLCNTPKYPNSVVHTIGNSTLDVEINVPFLEKWGVFYNFTADGPIPEYIGSNYVLGINYVHSVSEKASFRFDTGFVSSMFSISDYDNSIMAGGFGFAANAHYTYQLSDWFALRLALKNNFTWRKTTFEYTYPTEFLGMYYTKPAACTQLTLFTWKTNPCIEAVLIFGGK